MEADGLIRVVSIIVVPIDNGCGIARGQHEGIHRGHAGDIDLARAGNELIAHHAHGEAGRAAVVLLNRGPALEPGGVDGIGLHQILRGQEKPEMLLELGPQVLDARRYRSIALDLRQLAHRPGGAHVDLVGGGHNLGEIHRDHGDAGSLEQFLTGAHGLEGGRAGADRTNPRVAQAIGDPTQRGEVFKVLAKCGAVQGNGVSCRIGPRNAVLPEIIAHGDLAAERVATVSRIQLVQVIVAGLGQHR